MELRAALVVWPIFILTRSTFSSLYVLVEFQEFTCDQAFFLFESDQKGTLEKSGDTQAFLFFFLGRFACFWAPEKMNALLDYRTVDVEIRGKADLKISCLFKHLDIFIEVESS